MGEYDSYIAENTYYTAVNTARMLEEQKQTNQELNRLRNQMANANAMQQQMLQNQIRDIEERETQKFYKLRGFKLSQLVARIDNLTDINQKAFTFYTFKDVIMQNATDAQNNLNEISDKEYCNTIMSKANDINKQIGNIDELAIGEELRKIINGAAEYNRLCDELDEAQNAFKNVPPPPVKPQKITLDHPDRINRGWKMMFLGMVLGIIGAIVMFSDRHNMEVGIVILVLGVLPFLIGVGCAVYSTEEKVPTDAEINAYNNAVTTRNAHISQWSAKIAELKTQIANCDYMKALQYFFTNFASWKTEIDNCYKQLSY